MKRILSIILSLASCSLLLAQNDADALRFSQYLYSGTARSIAMGNAFGSLGGDITSLSMNPAGLGVYRSSEFAFTPGLLYNSSTSTYGPQSTQYDDFKYNFLLNNIGLVMANGSKNESGWIGTNFAIGYNRIADYNQNIQIISGNNSSSLLDEYAYHATTDYSSSTMAQLADETGLLYVPDSGIYPYEYYHDLDGIYNQTQERTISRKGGIGEYAFSIGSNYNHKLYLGATVGIQRVRYDETMVHSEYDDYGDIPYFRSFEAVEHISTNGVGYNLKVGAIYRPIEALRLGLAVHTPTFYKLETEFDGSIKSKFDSIISDSHAVSDILVSNYQLSSPLRLIASIGFQLKKVALFSADYEYVNYTKMRMRADNGSFTDVNHDIQTYYKTTNNLRLGAECKLGALALRCGYSYYGSPYVASEINKNASYSIYSAGIGFRAKNVSCDLTFAQSMITQKYAMYQLGYNTSAELPTATIKTGTAKILATIGFRF
jgi:hypothetical protein